MAHVEEDSSPTRSGGSHLEVLEQVTLAFNTLNKWNTFEPFACSGESSPTTGICNCNRRLVGCKLQLFESMDKTRPDVMVASRIVRRGSRDGRPPLRQRGTI